MKQYNLSVSHLLRLSISGLCSTVYTNIKITSRVTESWLYTSWVKIKVDSCKMQKKQWAADLHPSIWFINDFMKKVKNCNLWVYIQDCLLWQNIKLQDEFISNQTLHLFLPSSPVIDQTQNHFPNQSDEMDLE